MLAALVYFNQSVREWSFWKRVPALREPRSRGSFAAIVATYLIPVPAMVWVSAALISSGGTGATPRSETREEPVKPSAYARLLPKEEERMTDRTDTTGMTDAADAVDSVEEGTADDMNHEHRRVERPFDLLIARNVRSAERVNRLNELANHASGAERFVDDVFRTTVFDEACQTRGWDGHRTRAAGGRAARRGGCVGGDSP